MADWSVQLRQLRDKEALTRDELAHMAAVAPATLKSYELGHRNPSRQLLTAILDALKADMFTRSQILTGAGFSSDGRSPSERLPDEYFTLDEAVLELERSPFPSCVSNEVMEVVAANGLMQRVWEVDFARELQGPFDKSMMSMLSWPHVADHILNWDEAIGLAISIVKGHYGGEAAFMANQNPYFAAAMEHFLKGDPHYVQRFLGLWATTPARQRKLRFSYPVTWRHTTAGTLRFHVQVNPADQRGSLAFNDWIPLDEASWTGVRMLAADETSTVHTYAPG
jgi:transcriptional regulator with XRE-family HTH domain